MLQEKILIESVKHVQRIFEKIFSEIPVGVPERTLVLIYAGILKEIPNEIIAGVYT